MTMRQYRAFSLIELLVALAIGIFMSVGVVQLYSSNATIARSGDASARVQENGRLALMMLGYALRNADYWGCANYANINNRINPAGAGYNTLDHAFTTRFLVESGTAASGFPATHVVKIGGAASRSIKFSNAAGNTATTFSIAPGTGASVSQGDIFLLSDCNAGLIFQVSGTGANTVSRAATTPPNPGNVSVACPTGVTSPAACFTYGDLYRPYNRRYFVDTVSGRRGFYMAEGSGAAVELVEGVVAMQVQLGLAAASGATTVTSWVGGLDAGVNYDRVIAVRVSMLVQSAVDGVMGTAQSLCFPAWSSSCTDASPTNWTAPDRRRYSVYTTTMAIENRLTSGAP